MTLRRVRQGAWVLVAALVAALALVVPRGRVGALAGPQLAASDTTKLDGEAAPNFTLTDQTGQVHSLAAYRGRVVVLAFIDSRCTETCPLTAQALRIMQQDLGRRAPGVQLLAVNANPDATAVSDVQQWTDAHDMAGRWLFLTGTAQYLGTIWSAYHIGVEVEPDGAIVHTDAVYVIDRQGRERALLLTGQGGGVQGDALALQQAVSRLL